MRDDMVPPDTSPENKLQAALTREQQLRDCMHRWNLLAQSMGYDGVEPALQSLQAMKRGPQAITEIARCKKCVELEAQLVSIRRMNMRLDEGCLEADALFEGAAVKLWASSMAEWFRETGGMNYVTVEMSDPTTGERYSITMQRAGGKTPAQDLSELRARLSELDKKEEQP